MWSLLSALVKSSLAGFYTCSLCPSIAIRLAKRRSPATIGTKLLVLCCAVLMRANSPIQSSICPQLHLSVCVCVCVCACVIARNRRTRINVCFRILTAANVLRALRASRERSACSIARTGNMQLMLLNATISADFLRRPPATKQAAENAALAVSSLNFASGGVTDLSSDFR